MINYQDWEMSRTNDEEKSIDYCGKIVKNVIMEYHGVITG